MIKIGVIHTSGNHGDGLKEGIPEILNAMITGEWELEHSSVGSDSGLISQALVEFVDKKRCSLILTTGGIGPGSMDLTPEATVAVCDKRVDGFGELFRRELLNRSPAALVNRQIAGIRGRSLIINLPADPLEIRECLPIMFPAIANCIKSLGGPLIRFND